MARPPVAGDYTAESERRRGTQQATAPLAPLRKLPRGVRHRNVRRVPTRSGQPVSSVGNSAGYIVTMDSSRRNQAIRFALAVAMGAMLVVVVQTIAAYLAEKNTPSPPTTESVAEILRRATEEQDISKEMLALAALDSTDGYARLAAWRYCRAMTIVDAIPTARRMVLNEPNRDVVSEAVEYLSYMRDEGLAEVYLQDPKQVPEEKRGELARILKDVVSDVSERTLQKLTEEASPSVREQAYSSQWRIAVHKFNVEMYFARLDRTPVLQLKGVVFGLAAIGDEHCKTELRRLSVHESSEVRELAASRLRVLEKRSDTEDGI